MVMTTSVAADTAAAPTPARAAGHRRVATDPRTEMTIRSVPADRETGGSGDNHGGSAMKGRPKYTDTGRSMPEKIKRLS
jgi:hypothetical protein